MRLLVVEDDKNVAEIVRRTLVQAGYVVDVCYDGEEGQFLGETEPYDAVVLDLGLPLVNGLSVLENWRRAKIATPVLILSARDTWREKAFEAEELVARVDALIRRATGNVSPTLTCGPIELDTASNRITLNGAPVLLTAMEYKMLAYMLHHQGKVISKTEFTEHIYAQDFDKDSNTIEVLVSRLRKKFGARFIHTQRGQGYSLKDGDA